MKRMTFTPLLCALLLLLNFSLKAQSTQQQSVLWKISGNGLDKPSYLFGSLAIGCPVNYADVDDMIKLIMLSTEQLVLDAKKGDANFTQRTQKLILNDSGEDQYASLTMEQKGKLDSYLNKNFGAGLEQLNGYKPFVLQSLMSSKLVNCHEPVQYIEDLLAIAQKNKMLIEGFETIEEQVALFDKIDKQETLNALLEMVMDPKVAQDYYTEVSNAYSSQSLDEIKILMMDKLHGSTTEKVMLIERHKTWLPLLEEMIQDKSSFIAVGTLHMLDTGYDLITILRQKGYTLTPVTDGGVLDSSAQIEPVKN